MNIRQEFRPKIQEAGNGRRSVIGEELGKIVDVVIPASVVVAFHWSAMINYSNSN